MTQIFVPYFMAERTRDGARLGPGEVVEPALPAGTLQQRLGVLYRELCERVAASADPRVQVGDCVASLGVAAGLQRRGIDPWVVWLDGHGDFNTWETTPSGFLGGMPLAMMVGLGEQTIVEAVGLRPLPAEQVWLAGARDLDPGERDNLAAASVRQLSIEDLGAVEPPSGPIYLHLDMDVVNLDEMPAVDYPAPDGPPATAVRVALDRVFASGRVAAFSCTGWNPALPGADRSRETAVRLAGAFLGPDPPTR